jgi:hypothetical protein
MFWNSWLNLSLRSVLVNPLHHSFDSPRELLLIFAGAHIVLLIMLFCRKQGTGSLLADLGKTSQNKLVFRVGLIGVALAVLQTWSFFTLVSNGIPEYTILERNVSELIYWWSFASLCIALGLEKFEFRENGIYFMSSYIKWQRIDSYTWEPAKPNVLTIRFKPGFPILPGFMSIPIPTRNTDVVDSILDERLPGKNL